MKKIYILHQYIDKTHFKALYDCAEEYGYKIEDYFVADKLFILKNMIKKNIFRKKRGLTLKEGIKYLFKLRKLKKIENEILIVGLAPYDNLLNKYEEIIKKNKSIYFSSWQYWDGSKFPRGTIDNKKEFERILSSHFRAAACVSGNTYNSVNSFIDYSIVVNHAIDVSKYIKKNIFEIKHKYIFMGRFENVKNINYILDWIENRPDYDFQFCFAGSGSLLNNILELSKRDERVLYLGMLEKNEIQKIIHNYDFTILPSREEPFGIVLIESLAAGTPCLASDANGPIEIINHEKNGYIFDRNKKNEFFEYMDKIYNLDNKEYKKICLNALASSEKYSSEYLITEWNKLFHYVT